MPTKKDYYKYWRDQRTFNEEGYLVSTNPNMIHGTKWGRFNYGCQCEPCFAADIKEPQSMCQCRHRRKWHHSGGINFSFGRCHHRECKCQEFVQFEVKDVENGNTDSSILG